MAGPPVDNVAIDRVSESMRQPLMILAGVLGLGLVAGGICAICGWRSWSSSAGRIPPTLCLAIVAFTGGVMNSVLFTMPAVVYTGGLSAAIHVVNYYRHARAEQGLGATAERGLKAAWIPCLLSAGTTSLGLISLCTSAIVPIKTFGFYSAIGVMAAVGLIFLYLAGRLPALAAAAVRHPGHRRRQQPPQPTPPPADAAAGRAGHRPAAMGLGGVHGGDGRLRRRTCTAVKTTVNLMSLFSPHAQIIDRLSLAGRKTGDMVPMEVVLRLDEPTCKLTLVERLELVGRIQDGDRADLPQVGRTTSAVTFVPDLTPKKRGGLGGVFMRGSTWAADVEQAVEGASRRTDVGRLRGRRTKRGTSSCGGSASAWPRWPTSTTASSSTNCERRSSRW